MYLLPARRAVRTSGGVIFPAPTEPSLKRVVAFVDGQNLFHAAREAFGYIYPNFNPVALATSLCEKYRWHLTQTRFYTGVPTASDHPYWHHFWIAKLGALGHRGVHVFSRSLRYRNKRVKRPDGTEQTFLVGEEKGIDVRIALDVVRGAYRKEYHVALIFSQDQDLSEVADDIRTIARDQSRWMKIVCAFPYSPAYDRRGIERTDWIRIDRQAYDRCLDPRDYRPNMFPKKEDV